MKVLILPLLLMSLTGCGAFADAANSDGGMPDSGPSLSIKPSFILQGQLMNFEISFTRSPPWAGKDGGNVYLSKFDLGGDDIGKRNFSYDGLLTTTAVLIAESEAKTGERVVTITAVFEMLDQPQQTHTEWGFFYVHARPTTDGGSP